MAAAAIGFALQIYCDFSSYSIIAIGAAQVMGFTLMEIFEAPYFARSIKEFWRRWHISLSTWFRDYVYIPLGGNRCGRSRRSLNLMITFLLSGLWHGANWTFVAWGGIHGLYQIIGETIRPIKDRVYPKIGVHLNSVSHKLGQVIVTFVLTDIAWVFFRAESVRDAIGYLYNIIARWDPWAIWDMTLYNIGLSNYEWNVLLISLLVLFVVDLVRFLKKIRFDVFLSNQGALFKGMVIVFMILMIMVYGQYGEGYDAKQFIYFQFKIYGKRIISILLLFVVLAGCCLKYNQWAENPRGALYDFYRFVDKDTIDVLCVGSSHVYCGINPVQMFDDYGIAAYNLAAGSQALWFSYYYLKEALKTQTPKLIILDAYIIVHDNDARFDTSIQANLLNMKPSLNKWEALKTAGEENILDVFWQFPVTHTRYSGFDKDTFDMRDGSGRYLLGYAYTTRVVKYEPVDVSGVTECKAISPKAEEYLRKSIELCQTEGIDIILTNTPWPYIEEDDQKKFNYVQNIADEYGIEFINGCLYGNEMGMDYATDSYDGGHLNYFGAKKYTAWLTEKLIEQYDFLDRRGDEVYHHWQIASDRFQEVVLNNQLNGEKDLNGYLECLGADADRMFILLYNGTETDVPLEIRRLEQMNILLNEPSIYVVRDGKIVYNASAMGEYEYLLYFDDDVLYATCDGAVQTISLNRDNVVELTNDGDVGIVIFSYNELLGGYTNIGNFLSKNNFIR